jgi:hypothetical protein
MFENENQATDLEKILWETYLLRLKIFYTTRKLTNNPTMVLYILAENTKQVDHRQGTLLLMADQAPMRTICV